MKARIIETGEIRELIKADLDKDGKQLMTHRKPTQSYIDGFGWPFPCIIDSEGYLLNNGDIEIFD